MFIGTQYYRPPFPKKKYWQDDLSQMRDSGLDVVQLWVPWGWVEPEPGVFKFDDYDELMKEAEKRELKVVISTIAAIHPFWIHRVIPDSNMVDHMGHKVISSLRCECNVGLTPGGCSDNPKVQERMAAFLQMTAKHYADAPNLLGWDIWNENRWNINADGYVCYCSHTLKAFREWLDKKHGGLKGLNSAWQRRYSVWEDVFPGKFPDRPYSEMTEFLRFLSGQRAKHMRFRCEQIRSYDKKHIISAHAAFPCTADVPIPNEQALCRGNDWDLADQVDGYGTSMFLLDKSKKYLKDESVFGFRLESIRSAARGKVMWISELQGGPARQGIQVQEPVDASLQQRWIWNGYARGVKGIIFWCWRDEVFGRESAGYGLAGNDGFAEDRMKALKETGEILVKHNKLLDDYYPDDPKVGILFEPDNYCLNYAQDGNHSKAGMSVQGYLFALERLHIPYEIIESSHLDMLSKLKLLIMPWPLVMKKETADRILDFVRSGGTILCESELDAYTSLGFYRYSGTERSLAASFGIKDLGRRVIRQDEISVDVNGKTFHLISDDWFTPLESTNGDDILAKGEDGSCLGIKKQVEKGTVYALGTFVGKSYWKKMSEKCEDVIGEFEKFVAEIVKVSDGLPDIKIESDIKDTKLQWRTGISGSHRLLFVLTSGEKRSITVEAPVSYFNKAEEVLELRSGNKIPVESSGDARKFAADIETGSWNVYCWNV